MKIVPIHIHLIIMLLFCLFSAQAQNREDCKNLIQSGMQDREKLDYSTAIEKLTKAEKLADQNQWKKEHFLSLNNLGLTYFRMMDYGTAVTFFLKAYELAIQENDVAKEMTVLNNIGIVYMKEEKNEQAKEYFLKSLQIATDNGYEIKRGYYATNLAVLYETMQDYKVSKEYVSLAISKLDPQSREILTARVVESTLLLKEGKPEKVIENCKEYSALAKKNNFIEEEIGLSLVLSKAYYSVRDWEQAITTAEEALKFANNEFKVELFGEIAKAAIRFEMPKKALAAKDSIIELTNTINKNKNKELLENTTLRFELSESKHELQFSKTISENKNKLYGLVTLLLLLLLIVVITVFYKKNKFALQKKKIAENELRIKDLELEQALNNSKFLAKELEEKELKTLLEKEQRKEKVQLLQREIQQKNKQLSDKILFQSTRNELIEEIIQTISSDVAIAENKTLTTFIRNLKNHLKEDTKWEEFFSHFENVNNEFIQALYREHPNLNANEVRFLSFVYLHLTSKEIAALLHINPSSCRKRKERIVQKLGLDAETNLLEYLSHITISHNMSR
ncbi:tetratricopeptide (TPR) repeat protein [Flavobacterium arsenatis]|uniref:Tetratricopeptide (TPR) repeat protein n=1 Tax=Flavobacterium arsenatis TaxID=1484332 RepID=A0ABU1TSQ5_9FLAO|nr:tetratricopeptide repeat protein [Flavobacterium arsenatis]MDR6968910.1 tetratricopeptide (TPR) repeat protein [Flavobacterium arsenatis]